MGASINSINNNISVNGSNQLKVRSYFSFAAVFIL